MHLLSTKTIEVQQTCFFRDSNFFPESIEEEEAEDSKTDHFVVFNFISLSEKFDCCEPCTWRKRCDKMLLVSELHFKVL